MFLQVSHLSALHVSRMLAWREMCIRDRLKTDHIDIYLAHLDDGVTPIEEIVRGFDDLARAGKIVYGGLCNFPAWRVATAVTTVSYTHLS